MPVMIAAPNEDMFKAGHHVIVVPVHCTGKEGNKYAGLAKRYFELYPNSLKSYLAACEAGYLHIGHGVVDFNIALGQTGYFLPTKHDPWRPSKKIWVQRALRKFRQHIDWYFAENFSIGLPAAGCGLGGLSWSDEVLPDIEAILGSVPNTVVAYPPGQR